MLKLHNIWLSIGQTFWAYPHIVSCVWCVASFELMSREYSNSKGCVSFETLLSSTMSSVAVLNEIPGPMCWTTSLSNPQTPALCWDLCEETKQDGQAGPASLPRCPCSSMPVSTALPWHVACLRAPTLSLSPWCLSVCFASEHRRLALGSNSDVKAPGKHSSTVCTEPKRASCVLIKHKHMAI